MPCIAILKKMRECFSLLMQFTKYTKRVKQNKSHKANKTSKKAILNKVCAAQMS